MGHLEVSSNPGKIKICGPVLSRVGGGDKIICGFQEDPIVKRKDWEKGGGRA